MKTLPELKAEIAGLPGAVQSVATETDNLSTRLGGPVDYQAEFDTIVTAKSDLAKVAAKLAGL